MHRPRLISVGLLLAFVGLLALDLQAPAMAAARTSSRTTRATGQTPADVDPPVIAQPQDLVVTAVDASGATVAYRVPRASDAIDGVVPVACSPVSGSVFPVGQTVVSCAAQDQAGNRAVITFGVTVTVADRPVRAEPTVATETPVVTEESASTPTPSPTEEPEQVTETPAPTQEAETPTEAATATATPDDQSADPTTSATPDETAAADSATATPDATQEPTSTPTPSPTEEPADATPTAESDSPKESTATETSERSSKDSEATETPVATETSAATETPVSTEPADDTSAAANPEATFTPTETPTVTTNEGTDTVTPDETGTATPEATPADESGAVETATATATEPAAGGAASATPEADARSADATATPTTTASSTVTAGPSVTETATPSPTATVPAALVLPAVSPDDFVLAVDGGPIDGLAAIWRNQDFPITQEFGHTAFSIVHASWYAYGADYGLDGYEHPGIDIGMPRGTQLYSPVDGTVKIAGGVPFYTFYGNGDPGVGELLIETDDGDQVILGHMGRIAVSQGDRVEAGEFVGLSGGDNGDHLHLETRERVSGHRYRIVDPRRSFVSRAIAHAAREAEASRAAGDRRRT